VINKTLLQNIISLGILQGLNYILPLITVPYLLRTIGFESFGILAFANTIMGYFLIVTDYGFNWSASRQISLNREDKEKVNEIFSSVLIIKSFLLLICFLVLILCLVVFESLQQYWNIYLFSFGTVLGQILFPVWLFQGLEKMKYITIVNILGKITFTALIFLFVNSEREYYLVSIFNSLGFIVTGIISLSITRFLGIRFRFYSREKILFHLKDGYHIFLSTISISFYTISSTFILGLFSSYQFVGIFSTVDKIVQAAKGVYFPFSQAIYPMIGLKLKDGLEHGKSALKKMSLYLGILMFLVSLVLIVFPNDIINFVLGRYDRNAILILQIMSPLPFVVAFGNIFGVQMMLNLGYKKEFGRIVFLGAVFGIILSVYLTKMFGMFGTAATLTMVELFITILLGSFLLKKILII
jgi:PST family polysaccharide transporter